MTVQSSHTFNLKTGQVYTLKDLFDGDDYVAIINREIKKQIREKRLAEALFEPFQSIKANQDFYLTNNALVVYFQLYEYFPYAFGIPEFKISTGHLSY